MGLLFKITGLIGVISRSTGHFRECRSERWDGAASVENEKTSDIKGFITYLRAKIG